MMQSVPAHTDASRDALHYLVINYIYSCPDACLRLGGHKYKTYTVCMGSLQKDKLFPISV